MIKTSELREKTQPYFCFSQIWQVYLDMSKRTPTWVVYWGNSIVCTAQRKEGSRKRRNALSYLGEKYNKPCRGARVGGFGL